MLHSPEVTLHSPEVRDSASTAPDGVELRLRLLACTRCPLHKVEGGPIPFSGGPSKVAVVGEAPGPSERAQRAPFVGPAGQLLRSHFKHNGVWPDRLFYCNVVSCYPKEGNHKTPLKKHIDACRTNLTAQLEFSQAEWVLVAGNIALETVFPWPYVKNHVKTISRMHGIPWSYQNRYWMACIHPAAVLQDVQKYGSMFREDIEEFVKMVKSGVPKWGDECYECEMEVERYDHLGIAWCNKHYPGYKVA